MVKITEALVRKKSEHNDLMISTLEEVALHQEDIEKIEHIQNWCGDLKILLLQNNLIAKIENLHKLKKLEYLNLALNNIEAIENLEGLESLEKLDLTLNFIGAIRGVETLATNFNLKNLILTGNPCTDFTVYREFVVATLPQLQELDGVPVTRTEKFVAQKNLPTNRKKVVQQEANYAIVRDEQKLRVQHAAAEEEELTRDLDEEEKRKRFWDSKSEHCPETRIKISEQHRKARRTDEERDVKKEKKVKKLFADCGRPYSINEPKLEFQFHDEIDRYELNLEVYKFLDTSLINVDAQPNYVRITIKEKIFQMALTDEIKTGESCSKRSVTTGDLLIIMPKLSAKLNEIPKIHLKCPIQVKKSPGELKSGANYRNIVNPCNDESDIPPLI